MLCNMQLSNFLTLLMSLTLLDSISAIINEIIQLVHFLRSNQVSYEWLFYTSTEEDFSIHVINFCIHVIMSHNHDNTELLCLALLRILRNHNSSWKFFASVMLVNLFKGNLLISWLTHLMFLIKNAVEQEKPFFACERVGEGT